MNSAIMCSTHQIKENCEMRKYLTISVMTVFIVAVFFVVSNAAPSSNSDKNGWKFLTWGMSINETNILLVKNGMKPLKMIQPDSGYFSIIYGDDRVHANEFFESERIECGKSDLSGHNDDLFSFYFLDKKLAAVSIQYEKYSSEYMKAVMDQLQNKFPFGTIEEQGHYTYFSYIDNNIIVHNRPANNDRHNRYIWYINPDVIKIKKAIETIRKQREEKKSEESLEKMF